jgi:hypothetical protein
LKGPDRLTDTLTQKKARRFRFLNALYERTDGNEEVDIHMYELGTSLGFSREETDAAVQYLAGENLVEHVAFGGAIAITHFGVTQVEQALSSPEEPTEYFPPVINILNIGAVSGSQIQQAGHASQFSADLTATDYAALGGFIAELKAISGQAGADANRGAEFSAQVATLEAQIASPRPNRAILREALATIRSVLESMAGSIAASGLLERTNDWLGRVG